MTSSAGHPGWSADDGTADPASAGAPTDPAKVEALAKSMCLRWLTDRAHTRAELAAKLAGRGVDVAVADRVLDRFAEVGLVDDTAFAATLVRSRLAYSGKGRRAIARELRAKGVGQEDAEAALGGIDEEAERERARELVRQRLAKAGRAAGRQPAASAPADSGDGDSDSPRDRAAGYATQQKLARQLAGMLERRGFPPSVVFPVVQEELAAGAAGWEPCGEDV